MEGNSTLITDFANGSTKQFTFDHSFWSHDGYVQTPYGKYVAQPGSEYVDQQKVYDELGQQVLENAWQGYNCCLFAYGQTGSGKSYSMVGDKINRGIIPIVCDKIFERIQENEDPNKEYHVELSMLEIYNEKLTDLLDPYIG